MASPSFSINDDHNAINLATPDSDMVIGIIVGYIIFVGLLSIIIFVQYSSVLKHPNKKM